MAAEIILASGSPRRRMLLEQVGIVPEICVSDADETTDRTDPQVVVAELSKRKARDVARRCSGKDAVIIGADTVVSLDGIILGKPRSEEEAREMIGLLQGRTHEVFTGVYMIFTKDGSEESFVEKTEVEVSPMSCDAIAGYVDLGESMDKAGAYGIQGRFAAYINGIRGDYNNVVGLPVAHICSILRQKGILI